MNSSLVHGAIVEERRRVLLNLCNANVASKILAKERWSEASAGRARL